MRRAYKSVVKPTNDIRCRCEITRARDEDKDGGAEDVGTGQKWRVRIREARTKGLIQGALIATGCAHASVDPP